MFAFLLCVVALNGEGGIAGNAYYIVYDCHGFLWKMLTVISQIKSHFLWAFITEKDLLISQQAIDT